MYPTFIITKFVLDLLLILINIKIMNLVKFILNLILNIKKNNNFTQLVIFIILLLVLGILGIFSLIKVVIPFTYIAL